MKTYRTLNSLLLLVVLRRSLSLPYLLTTMIIRRNRKGS